MIFGYRCYDRLAPDSVGLACFKIGGDYAMAFGAFVVEIFIAVNSFKESCDFLSFGHIKCKFVCAVFFGGKGMLIHHAHAIVSAEVQLMCQCDLLCVLGQIVFHKSDRLTAIICILGRRMNILTVESHGVEKSVFGLLGNIFHIVFNVLGALRLELADRKGLRKPDDYRFLWVTEFPQFEWSDEEERFVAMHHPFTMPNPDDLPLLEEHPEQVRAKAYDFVCNGIEVGGGSLRIHDTKLQERMFEVLGFTPERAQAQFGFLMNAFKYGAPPHAGLAFGLDRFVSIMAGLDSIRDCIAFPKNNSGRDVMLDAPSALDPKQLDELNLKIDVHQA